MVAPHPDLERRINNVRNIVGANKSQFVPGLYTKYPRDYIDLDTYGVFDRIKPWEEEPIPILSQSIQSGNIRYESTKSKNIIYGNASGRLVPTQDKILILCADFADQPWQIPISTIYNRFFSTTGNSFMNYYKEVSYGQYIPYGEVHGWYRAPQNSFYYINGEGGMGLYPTNAQKLVEDIVNIAKNDPSIDWASFDTDNNGYLDNIIVIHSGPEAAANGNRYRFWAHAYIITSQITIQEKTVWRYALSSEYINSPSDIQISGVDCHEFGHMLGLPDLYSTTGTSSGTGNYSLMSVGSWAGPGGAGGSVPVHLDAWSKSKLGYTITTENPIGEVSLSNAEINNINIKYTTSDPNEYFMVENRQKTLFDTYLSAHGILIWHINENMGNNNNPYCYKVGLIQADGLKDLENKINIGDSGDSYPGSTNNRSFGQYTNPNSLLCNGTTKDMLINNISDSANTMTFDSILPVPVVQAGFGLAQTILLIGLAVGMIYSARRPKISPTSPISPELSTKEPVQQS